MSASVNLPLHHKVQRFSFGTGSPGWSRKKGLQNGCGGAVDYGNYLARTDESIFFTPLFKKLNALALLAVTEEAHSVCKNNSCPNISKGPPSRGTQPHQ